MDFKQGRMKFRPQDYNKGRWLRWMRNNQDQRGLYNWQNYLSVKIQRKAKYTAIMQIGHHLHYLGCHAPKPVRKKWYPNWLRFIKHYPKL